VPRRARGRSPKTKAAGAAAAEPIRGKPAQGEPARKAPEPAPPPASSVDQFLWDRLYHTGLYRKHWEYDFPSQELVALLAARRHLFDAARQKATPASLDLGCGTGTEAIYLAEQGFESYGIDISPAGLALAYDKMRRRGVQVEFRRGSVLELPYAKGKFSFVNDRGCFHHIATRDRPQYAREVARVMRRGGVFLLRGADARTEEEFVPLQGDELVALFQSDFHLGPMQSIQMVSNAGTLPALLAVLERK